MDAAVVATDVARHYGETVAVDGVSLRVDPGEVFGLAGPNGAGKTTLVRALTGTTNPDRGSVRVLGEAPAAVDPNRVGLLPQSFRPAERLTARELLSYYAGLYESPRDPAAVLSDVGLADDADVRYGNLSGGQQRRVCVGSALINDPEVLFLDEPTTGIDPAGRRALWALLEDLADAGSTLVLTSHSMREIERLADRVGLLQAGELIAVGTPADLVAEHGAESRLLVRGTGPGAAGIEVSSLEVTLEDTDDGLLVRGAGPPEIGDVVRALDREDVSYESLVWTEPGLEEVYLDLTGERLGETPPRAGDRP